MQTVRSDDRFAFTSNKLLAIVHEVGRRLCYHIMYIIIQRCFAANLISDLMDFWCLSMVHSSSNRRSIVFLLLIFSPVFIFLGGISFRQPSILLRWDIEWRTGNPLPNPKFDVSQNKLELWQLWGFGGGSVV